MQSRYIQTKIQITEHKGVVKFIGDICVTHEFLDASSLRSQPTFGHDPRIVIREEIIDSQFGLDLIIVVESVI